MRMSSVFPCFSCEEINPQVYIYIYDKALVADAVSATDGRPFLPKPRNPCVHGKMLTCESFHTALKSLRFKVADMIRPRNAWALDATGADFIQLDVFTKILQKASG